MQNSIRCFVGIGLLSGVLVSGQTPEGVVKPQPPAENLSTQNTPKPWSLQAASMVRNVTKPIRMNYLLYLPHGHNPAGAYHYPVMLFLHGAGERGTDLEKVKVHGPPKVKIGDPSFAAIIISPQCPEGQTWDRETLMALLDEVIYRYRGDSRRVYLTGLSMGGYAAWDLATAHPERFAAVVPICGGGSTLPIKLASGAQREALKNLPIWAFHGEKDSVVDPSESRRMVEALTAIGSTSVKLTVYPEAGHDSWTETYDNPGLYSWLNSQNLEHKKPPAK